MAVFTPESYASRQLERARNVPRSVRAALEAEAREAMAEAVRLSSGPVHTARSLRLAGHPYARRSPRAAALPLGQISGRLRSSWRMFRREAGGTTTWTVQNVSPEAAHALAPFGTRRMIARPVVPTVREKLRRGAFRSAVAAKRRAER